MRLSFPMKAFWRLGAAAVLSLLCVSAVARERDPDAGVSAASAASDAGDAGDPAGDPRAAQIRALIAGTLAVNIEPQSMFDVPLTDEQAVQVEVVRLRALLNSVDESLDAGIPRRASKPVPAASAANTARAQIEALDPERWRSREALDRARFDFYSLSVQQRAALLATQATRVEAAKPKETDEQRRAREAEDERQKALLAAQTARSEAERVIAKESARLIDVERAVTATRDQFKDVHVALASRKDSLLGWQRRVSDAKAGSALAADDTYDALRKTLRASRDALDKALDQVDSAASTVPDLGADPLSDAPADGSTEQLSRRRVAVQRLIASARQEERALREDRASTLLTEIDSLNRGRLALLSYLSQQKQAAITGFTSAGLDQASSEARQLLLILRYHRHIAEVWLGDLRSRRGIAGVSGVRVAAVAVPWLAALAVFVWLRRRSVAWLRLAELRSAEADRREQRATPSLLRRALRFLLGFHRTLEWLLLYAVTLWLLPDAARGLLELQLLEVIIGWTLGGALIVNVINALATVTDSAGVRGSDIVGPLRLRSLRLVGRVIVAFILVLLVSARLVGEGTVYHWVSSTCWLAAVPVFLLLVRWWRDIVFERVQRVRRKSTLQAWVLANRSGWKSFFAAMVAAVQLFALGAFKVVRNWITGFNLARRAHAYLFKRELDRLAGEKPAAEFAKLRRSAFESLAPDRASAAWVECAGAERLSAFRAGLNPGRAGVVAVVGGRGSGKTSLLSHFLTSEGGGLSIDCNEEGALDRARALLEQSRAADSGLGASPILFLDNAHALVKPIRGGLRAFDEVLAFARASSEKTLWVFAIDAVVWPFLSRARDARPLFDEVITLRPWSDEQIGALLSARSAEAEITPTFEDLLEKLPPAADEIDKQEALAARRAGYFRMVWDYARGNPALALEVWRASLSEDSSSVVRVGSLAAPNSSELDSLPDSALFILRAILQLDPATVSDIAKATRLAEAHVENTVRFGQHHGYLMVDSGRIRVAWRWLRSVLVLLERRHLLVNP